MATATVFKVSKTAATKLCHDLGFKAVDKWTDARLKQKLAKLDSTVDEDTEVEDEKSAALLKKILAALESGSEIELVDKPTAIPPAKGKPVAKKVAAEPEEEEEEEEEADDEEASAEEEEEEEAPKKKAGKKPAAKGKPVATNAGGGKKPGIIATVIAVLKKGSETKPVTKDQILQKLIAEFPDREERAMKSTVASQVPSGLKTEKGIILGRNDKGYWITDSNGY